MPGPYWSDNDIALMRRHYGKRPVEEVCAILGRSKCSVRQRAMALRLGRPIPRLCDYEDRLRELQRQGKSRKEMARELGVSKGAVDAWLKKLRISTRYPDTYARTRKRVDAKMRAWGFRGLADYAATRRRLKWGSLFPGCISRNEVLIARHLLEHGPSTQQQIMEATGISKGGCWYCLKGMAESMVVQAINPERGRGEPAIWELGRKVGNLQAEDD